MNIMNSVKGALAAATSPLRKTVAGSVSTGDCSMVHVDSPAVQYHENHITANYSYQETEVHAASTPGGALRVVPVEKKYTFKTETKVPRTGVMIVGWGGNNGTTLTAALIANRKNLTWETKDGTRHANYFGSITQAATMRLGAQAGAGSASSSAGGAAAAAAEGAMQGRSVYVPMKSLLPMVEPGDLVVGGWWVQ